MVKAVIHILLSATVLFSTMGFTMFERLCSVSGRDIALTANHDACCEGHHHKQESQQPKARKSCCKVPVKAAPVSIKSSNCCEFNPIFLKAHAGAPTVDWKAPVLDASSFTLHPVAMLAFTELNRSVSVHQNQAFAPDPPEGRDIRVLHQSFRC